MTTSTVAALLTILGYSLYDTIIVFDRIRENVPRMPRATFSQIANRSMSRGVHAVAGHQLLDAAAGARADAVRRRDAARTSRFALLVGVASGAYSSIFIATPVLTQWKERERVYMRRRRIVMEEHGGEVPAFASSTLGDDDEERTGDKPATPRARRAGPARTPGRLGAAPSPRAETQRRGAGRRCPPRRLPEPEQEPSPKPSPWRRRTGPQWSRRRRWSRHRMRTRDDDAAPPADGAGNGSGNGDPGPRRSSVTSTAGRTRPSPGNRNAATAARSTEGGSRGPRWSG